MSQPQLLAIDEINATGELPFKFELVIEDHKTGDVKAGIAATRKFIDLYDMQWINASWANVVVAIQPICAENRVVEWNGGGADPKQIGKPFLHNNRITNDQFILPMIRFMANKMGMKRIAVLHNVTPEGIAMRNTTYWEAPKLGLEVVGMEGFEEGSTDMRSGIAKIRAKRPDGVLIAAWSEDVGYCAKQIREMGIKVPICGGCSLPNEALPIAGEAFDEMHVCIEHFDVRSELPWTKQFVKNYKARWNEMPDNYSANYYEAVYALKDCIKHVMAKGEDPWNGELLDKGIVEIKTFPSLYGDGKMALLEDGSCLKPYGIYQFHYDTKEWELVEKGMPPPTKVYPNPD
jgi:branched-chain amino acid transport system substrate-binding protein